MGFDIIIMIWIVLTNWTLLWKKPWTIRIWFPWESNKLLCNFENLLATDFGTLRLAMILGIFTIYSWPTSGLIIWYPPKAILIMRTEANTPSFLFGHHWQATQALGQKVASEGIINSPTPAAIVVYRDRQICLPTSIFKTNANIAARLIAHEITMDKSYFCCALCGETFVERGPNSSIRISEFGVSPSGHMFRRECVQKYREEQLKLDEAELS